MNDYRPILLLAILFMLTILSVQLSIKVYQLEKRHIIVITNEVVRVELAPRPEIFETPITNEIKRLPGGVFLMNTNVVNP